MNKKISFLLLFSIIICNFSCIKSQTNSNIDFLNDRYYKEKLYFKKSYINFFPKKLDYTYLNSTISLPNDESNTSYFVLYKTYNKKDEINKIIKKSLVSYKADENCLNLIDRFSTSNDNFRVKEKKIDLLRIDYECIENKYPIPNFWFKSDFYSEETESHLSPDFTIYVLEVKKGRFLNSNCIDYLFMPKEWEHGYSKGVAISEKQKVIIYWVIIW